jgi:hypothetical protein
MQADGARIVSITAVGPHDYRVDFVRDGVTRGFVFTIDDGVVPVVSSSRDFNVAMHYNQADTLDLVRAVAALHTARKTALAVELDLAAPWRALLAQAVSAGDLDPESACPVCATRRLRLEVTERQEDGAGSGALWCDSCLNGVSFENSPVPAGRAVFSGALPAFWNLRRDEEEEETGEAAEVDAGAEER